MGHWRNQRENQKIPRDKWKQKYNDPKPMGHSKTHSKRKVYSKTILPQEVRKVSNKQCNLNPKQLEKGQTKPKVSRRKEIKDQDRNKWNRDKESNRKDQWN